MRTMSRKRAQNYALKTRFAVCIDISERQMEIISNRVITKSDDNTIIKERVFIHRLETMLENL